MVSEGSIPSTEPMVQEQTLVELLRHAALVESWEWQGGYELLLTKAADEIDALNDVISTQREWHEAVVLHWKDEELAWVEEKTNLRVKIDRLNARVSELAAQLLTLEAEDLGLYRADI